MNEDEWKAVYIKQATALKNRFLKKTLKKSQYVANLLLLAEVVKRHPKYPQPELQNRESESSLPTISILVFLNLLNSGQDVSSFLVAHHRALLNSASKIEQEKFWDKFLKFVGSAGVLYGLWKILCHLVLGPLLGISCDLGPSGGDSVGSLVSSLSPLAWIFGGIGLILIHRILSSGWYNEQKGGFVMVKTKKLNLSPELATAIGTWVTIILVVVSILLVWKQIRDLKTSVENQTYQSVYQTEFDIHKYFLEHPEYRPYFYENKKPPNLDENERIKLDTLTEWVCDFFDDVYQQRDTMTPDTFIKWRQFMKDIYQTSPILQEFIAKRGTRWYPDDFVTDIKKPSLDVPLPAKQH